MVTGEETVPILVPTASFKKKNDIVIYVERRCVPPNFHEHVRAQARK